MRPGWKPSELQPSVWAGRSQLLRRVLILAPAAFYSPLVTMATNFGYVTRHYRYLVIGAASLSLGLLATYIFDKTRLQAVSTPLAFLLVCVLALGGHLSAVLSPWGLLLLVASTVSVIWRLRERKLVDWLTAWAALFLALSVAVAAGETLLNWSSGSIDLDNQDPITLGETEKDVVFVVLDGFPSKFTEPFVADFDPVSVENQLVQMGFRSELEMRASYSLTHAAVPSLMSMSLLLDENDRPTQAVRRRLSSLQGGGGRLYETFRRAGYHITIVESGWAALRCVDARDTCVDRPWIDDGTYPVLRDSIVRPLVDRVVPNEWYPGLRHTLRWITTELEQLKDNQKKDFVFMHVFLPHPPLIFDEECEVRREDRAGAFVEQVACTLSVIEMISNRTEDAIVVLVGDHGTNQSRVMALHSERWSQEMFDERMHTLGAVRGLECDEAFPTVNTNIGIYVARCLGGEIPYVDNTAYVTPLFSDPFQKWDFGGT